MLGKKEFVKPNDLVISYTAGLIDGEGSVTISHDHHDPNAKRIWYHSLQFSLTNTNYEIMDWLVSKWNLGKYYKNDNLERNKVTISQRRQAWYWYCGPTEAVILLECVYPYLIIKKTEAFICIVFQQWKIAESKAYGKLRPDISFERESNIRDLLLSSRQADFNTTKEKLFKILDMEMDIDIENRI